MLIANDDISIRNEMSSHCGQKMQNDGARKRIKKRENERNEENEKVFD